LMFFFFLGSVVMVTSSSEGAAASDRKAKCKNNQVQPKRAKIKRNIEK
jgi:hypothetical protein